ncbi:MAG: ATP-binding protein [Verrucomicrobiia bacterium]
MSTKDLIKKALKAKRESKQIEFKRDFNPESTQSRCETVKDIVAIANCCGGIIIVGVDNNGNPVGTDVSAVLGFDQAKLVDLIASYTGVALADIEIVQLRKSSNDLAGIVIPLSNIGERFNRPIMPNFRWNV